MAVNINIPSQVTQTITDGVTSTAPSENAVHDALALKANSADLAEVATSGDYNDLINQPTIPAAQVNSDWNAISGVEEILNKPTIPDVSGFVPYTGANANLDMGTYNLTADHISLNVSPSGSGFNVGSTQWNNTNGMSETLLKGGSVTLKNGVDLVARVVNKVVPNTTLTKAAYQVVKVSGATGGRLSVGLAKADVDLNSADTIGLVTETIATNQEGFILTMGQIEDINTTGSLQGETWADGDVLYLSPTTAGKLTNIKPTGATGHIVVIGYVEYSHANNGKIYVKIMNGWELDELHNVSITSVANNDLLQYDSVTALWKNESLGTAGIQPTLVSGTSIKTVNSTSLLGSGNVAVQDTLVSGTNIKTINGTSLLGSGDITVGGGITIGTTAITSGTVGRILFQGTGDVTQQDSSLFWDNTNKRLGIGATPSTSVRLDVRSQGSASTDIAFRVRNSADTANLFEFTGAGTFRLGGTASLENGFSYLSDGRLFMAKSSGNFIELNPSPTNNRIFGGTSGWEISTTSATKVVELRTANTALQVYGGSVQLASGLNAADGTNVFSITSGTAPSGNYADSFKLYSADRGGAAGKASAHFRAEDGTINVIGDLSGFGTSAPGARLDVRAQGALSTDIAFRVRNSADTANLFAVRGNSDFEIPTVATNGEFNIYQSTIRTLKIGDYGKGSISFGQNSNFANTLSRATIIGSEITSTGIESFAGGFNAGVSSAGGIAIGFQARADGSDNVIKIGRGNLNSHRGTNSIHLGNSGAFQNFWIEADNILALYFNSNNQSHIAKSNGSFGLLGATSFITNNTNLASSMGDGGNTLVVKNHSSIPSINVVDSFQQYSADIVAGNAAPHFRTEAGNIIKLYQQSSSGITTVSQLVTVLQNLGLLS